MSFSPKPATAISGWLKLGSVLFLASLLLALVFVVPGLASQLSPDANTFTIGATPNPGSLISPGQLVTYTVTFINNGPDTYSPGTIQVTFPITMSYVSSSGGVGCTGGGNIATCGTPELAPSQQIVMKATGQLASTQVLLHALLSTQATATLTIKGSGTPYSPTPAVTTHNVIEATITKLTQTSVNETNNSNTQAVAGEYVTVTVSYAIPKGTIAYSFTPEVLVQDGLMPLSSNPAWTNMYQGINSVLKGYDSKIPNVNGSLLIIGSTDVTNTDASAQTVSVVVRTVRVKNYYTGSLNEINDNAGLGFAGGARWCALAACSPAFSDTTKFVKWDGGTGSSVNALIPSVVPVIEAANYQDTPDHVGAGGDKVVLTVKGTVTGNRPRVFETVMTATVGSGLVVNGASNGGVFVPGPGNTTIVSWNLPSPLAPATVQRMYITATLPTTFTVGTTFPVFVTSAWKSLWNAYPYRGTYTKSDNTYLVKPGISSSLSKTSIHSNIGYSWVTMGDVITYTVTFKQGAKTRLVSPFIIDTLPLGFHYVTGSLNVSGLSKLSETRYEGPSVGNDPNKRYYENLRWNMAANFAEADTTITAVYAARNTGLDYRGNPVYDSTGDLRSNKSSSDGNTGATLTWTPPQVGTTFSFLAKANPSGPGILQPDMANNGSLPALYTERFDSGNIVVGGTAILITSFRNTGSNVNGVGVAANELKVCDTLPFGFIYLATSYMKDYNGALVPETAYTKPAPSSEGNVCWSFPALPYGSNTNLYYKVAYMVQAGPATIPGIYTNHANIQTYSSKPGNVTGERLYSTIPAAIPAPANCNATCLPVLGLAAKKTAIPAEVAPNAFITYTISYTDTVADGNSYTGIVITDTYDTLLTFVSANPSPVSQDAGNNRLVWNVASLPDTGNGQITLVMRVASQVEGQYQVVNHLSWDSDQTQPHTIEQSTPLRVPNLHFKITAPATTSAGANIDYTVTYSNTGAVATGAVLTVNYGPYVSYVSASIPPSSGNNQFTLNVPAGGGNSTLTIHLKTKSPLPYELTQFGSSATLEFLGMPTRNSNLTVSVQRPVFTFYKEGPPLAPSAGGIIRYSFTLINTGDIAATNLVITDTFDAQTQFSSGTGWTLGPGSTYATYHIASLAPGEQAAVDYLYVQAMTTQTHYTNRAQLASTQTTAQQTSLQTWMHSIALSASAQPLPAFPGRVLYYTLNYTNTDIAIADALITDTLPAGFTYQGNSLTNATGCGSGWNVTAPDQNNTLTFTCTNLGTNATGSFSFWGTVNAAEKTTLINKAGSSGSNGAIPPRPLDPPLSTYVARPHLRVDAQVAPTHPVAPGDQVYYTFTYSNQDGSWEANNVLVKDTLPSALSFDVSACSPACSAVGNTITWAVGNVPAGQTGTVTVYGTVKAGTAEGTYPNADFTIESDILNTSETNHGPAVSFVVMGPQLSLKKVASVNIVNALDDIIQYTIYYTNTGGGTLNNVVLTDIISNTTLYDQANSSQLCQRSGAGVVGGTVTCNVGILSQGQSGSLVIQVSVASVSQTGSNYTNQVSGLATEVSQPSYSNVAKVCYKVCLQAGIDVPASVSINLLLSSPTGSKDLVIKNTGNVAFDWSLTYVPSAPLWLNVSSTGGTIDTGASSTITLTFNGNGMQAGTYTVTLRIHTLAGDRDVVVTMNIISYQTFMPLVIR